MKTEAPSFIYMLSELKKCRNNSAKRKEAGRKLYDRVSNDLMRMCRKIVVRRGITIEYDEVVKNLFGDVVVFMIEEAANFEIGEKDNEDAVRGKFFCWLKNTAINMAGKNIKSQCADRIQRDRKEMVREKNDYLFELEQQGATKEEIKRKRKKYRPSLSFDKRGQEILLVRKNTTNLDLGDSIVEAAVVDPSAGDMEVYQRDKLRESNKKIMQRIVREELRKLKGIRREVLFLTLKHGSPMPSKYIDMLVKKFGIKRGSERSIRLRLIEKWFPKIRKRYKQEKLLAIPSKVWEDVKRKNQKPNIQYNENQRKVIQSEKGERC